jgi:hypothetical protein
MVRIISALFFGSAISSVAAYIQYSTVTGYFLQDNNATNATTFDYVSCSVNDPRIC